VDTLSKEEDLWGSDSTADLEEAYERLVQEAGGQRRQGSSRRGGRGAGAEAEAEAGLIDSLEGALEQLTAGLQAPGGDGARAGGKSLLSSSALAAELAADEELGDVLRGDAELDALEELGFDEDDFLSSLDKNISSAAKKAAKAAGRPGEGGAPNSRGVGAVAAPSPAELAGVGGALGLPGVEGGDAAAAAFDDVDAQLDGMAGGFGALLQQEQARAKKLAQAEEQRKKQQQQQQQQQQQAQKSKKATKLSYVRGDVLSAWADTYKTK
jgi:hypothetical protein